MFVDFFGDDFMNIDSSEENVTINNISIIPQNNFNNNIIKNKKILNEDWNNELNQIKIKKDEMNKIIANYFIIQGYKEALNKFINETGIKVEYDENLLNERVIIRNLIMNGKIEEAINEINNINCQILENNTNIHFELKKQKLVELIKENKIDEAIKFAQNVLYPITENNEKLLNELEKVMSLLAFNSIDESPFKELGKKENLKKLSSIVNLTILAEQMQPSDLILQLVLKLLKFSQNELKKEITFPEIVSICPFSFSKVDEDEKEDKKLEEKDKEKDKNKESI